MSNNVWWTGKNSPNWAEQGNDCSPEHRSKGFAKVYAETAPDIIGLQECAAVLTDNITQALKKHCTIPYALLWGRDTPIIYRTDKFDLVDSCFDVFPENVPGYEGSFNNLKTKSYCIGVFKVKQSEKHLIFATTHLWYMKECERKGSDYAREHQLNIVMKKLELFKAKYNCPVVLVGDFNATYSSQEVQFVVRNGYTHAYFLATEHRDETSGYHVCNSDHYEGYDNPQTFHESIDQFFINNFKDNAIKVFDRFYPEYYYPLSDHFPMLIDIEL